MGTGRLQIEITTIFILEYNQLRMEGLMTEPHPCIINLGCRRSMTQNVEVNRLNVRDISQIVQYLHGTERRIAGTQVFS